MADYTDVTEDQSRYVFYLAATCDFSLSRTGMTKEYLIDRFYHSNRETSFGKGEHAQAKIINLQNQKILLDMSEHQKYGMARSIHMEREWVKLYVDYTSLWSVPGLSFFLDQSDEPIDESDQQPIDWTEFQSLDKIPSAFKMECTHLLASPDRFALRSEVDHRVRFWAEYSRFNFFDECSSIASACVHSLSQRSLESSRNTDEKERYKNSLKFYDQEDEVTSNDGDDEGSQSDH